MCEASAEAAGHVLAQHIEAARCDLRESELSQNNCNSTRTAPVVLMLTTRWQYHVLTRHPLSMDSRETNVMAVPECQHGFADVARDRDGTQTCIHETAVCHGQRDE